MKRLPVTWLYSEQLLQSAMFSYRHAYHAGNHADVLKHLCLVSALDYLRQKETALCLIDTHAGAGLYNLRGHESRTSGEMKTGIEAVLHNLQTQPTLAQALPSAFKLYLQQIQKFGASCYPGSPCLMQSLMRPQDQLKTFEWLHTDARTLIQNLQQYKYHNGFSSATQVLNEDGFTGIKRFLPPSSRRGLILIDPSYELKTDYRMVEACLTDALTRFVTGCFIIWHPMIARPEAYTLPKRLKKLSQQKQRPWLQATLTLKALRSANKANTTTSTHNLNNNIHKLNASSVLVINPPYTLKTHLQQSLPILAQCLSVSQIYDAQFHITDGM